MPEPETDDLRTRIDATRPHPARMYDHYLGGKTNYEADREAAEEVLKIFPAGRTVARAQRDLMRRTTNYLTREAGIDQFLDVGTGIPTEPNLHQVAQAAEPAARVVYVDNDPIVLAYGHALLHGTPEGSTGFVLADVRAPETIYGSQEMRALDLNRPVALCLLGVTLFLGDEDDPQAIVRRLLDPLPSGSYLALSTVTHDFDPELWDRLKGIYRERGVPLRTYAEGEVAALFGGLELVDPGVVVSHTWRPDAEQTIALDTPDCTISMYAGVARKP
ncbi:SAM-dependent methyltransferase [Streptomyces sp.]|uniref:SAM-dependent methyltransferase n=1 Tax=Streptomyces sp. TaxID=1931 RepID=UPI002F41FFE1